MFVIHQLKKKNFLIQRNILAPIRLPPVDKIFSGEDIFHLSKSNEHISLGSDRDHFSSGVKTLK